MPLGAPDDVTDARHERSRTDRDARRNPTCGSRVRGVAFIEPPHSEVLEKILRPSSAPCALPDSEILVDNPEGASDEPREVTWVDTGTFWATF